MMKMSFFAGSVRSSSTHCRRLWPISGNSARGMPRPWPQSHWPPTASTHLQQHPQQSSRPRLLQIARYSFFLCLFKRFYLFFREGEGRAKERERNIDVRNIDWLPLAHPQLGTWPTIQARALTRIELETFGFEGWCPIHWPTPVRARYSFNCLFIHPLSKSFFEHSLCMRHWAGTRDIVMDRQTKSLPSWSWVK